MIPRAVFEVLMWVRELESGRTANAAGDAGINLSFFGKRSSSYIANPFARWARGPSNLQSRKRKNLLRAA